MTAAMGIPSGGEGAGLADSPPKPHPRRQALQGLPLGPAQAWGWVFVIAGNPGNPAR